MRRRRDTIWITGLLAVCSFVGGLAGNLAASAVPEALRPHMWVFWPLTLVFGIAAVGLTVAGAVADTVPDDDTVRERAILLRRVGREVRVAREDRLPKRLPYLDLAFHLRAMPLPAPGARLEHHGRSLPAAFLGQDEVFGRFEEEHGLCLIGAPGAGKTTALWLLAERLLERAVADPLQPVPLVVNLSSWNASNGSFEDWAVQQLGDRYGIGRDLARRWLDTAAVSLLLDGLDEVEPGRRRVFVEALGAFHASGQRPLALTSRSDALATLCGEEGAGSGKQGAPDPGVDQSLPEAITAHWPVIALEPLTDAQIEAYARECPDLAEALASLPPLRELARTPLWLNVSAEVFAEARPGIGAGDDRAALEAVLWDAYVRRMITRVGDTLPYYEAEVRRYMGWLTATLRRQGLTELWLERMQPVWLDLVARRRYRRVAGLVDGLASGLAVGLASGLASGLAVGPMVVGLASGIASGLLSGLMGGIHASGLTAVSLNWRFSWRVFLVVGLVSGLCFGLTFGLVFGKFIGLIFGLVNGIVFGIAFGLILRFVANHSHEPTAIKPSEEVFWSWRGAFTSRIRWALIIGLASGVMLGIILGLAGGFVGGLEIGLMIGLVSVLLGTLIFGIVSWFNLGWQTDMVDAREMRRPNAGIYRSLRNAARAALPLLSLAALSVLAALLSGNRWFFLGLILIAPAYLIASSNGLEACLRHMALRLTLRGMGYAPWGYVRFLEKMCDLQLLWRRGGGFAFYHVTLRDHLAGEY